MKHIFRILKHLLKRLFCKHEYRHCSSLSIPKKEFYFFECKKCGKGKDVVTYPDKPIK